MLLLDPLQQRQQQQQQQQQQQVSMLYKQCFFIIGNGTNKAGVFVPGKLSQGRE
jgi:hypothetical protein